MSMTFLSIESIQLYGIPVEVDGVKLSLIQARILAGNVGKIMDDTGASLKESVGAALRVFRKLYDLEDGKWVPKKMIQLGHGNNQKVIRSKFYDLEKDMGRVLAKKKTVTEAGARNNKRDKQSIVTIVDAALSQLSAEDQENILKTTLKRLSLKIRGA